MSSSGNPEGLKVRTLRALSGRGGSQQRFKVGGAILLVGVIVMFAWSFLPGLLLVAAGVVVSGILPRKRP